MIVSVFPRLGGGTFLFHRDTDRQRPTYGKYIPPHKRFDHVKNIRDAAYDALRSFGIEGEVIPDTYFLAEDRFHYVVANVNAVSGPDLKPFDPRLVLTEGEIAYWVPKVMEEMGIL